MNSKLVLEAVKFATEAHKDQFRKWQSGPKGPEPYIRHPIRVEMEVRKYTDDDEVLAAAILHDVVEDCNVELSDVAHLFGINVSILVWELTNPSKQFPKLKRNERKKIDRDHIAKASADAQIIKACDRIDNLKSMKDAPFNFVSLYLHESLLLSDVLTKIPESLLSELSQTIKSIGVKYERKTSSKA